MKQISILSKKTIELEGKLNSMMDFQTPMEKTNNTDETKSNES